MPNRCIILQTTSSKLPFPPPCSLLSFSPLAHPPVVHTAQAPFCHGARTHDGGTIGVSPNQIPLPSWDPTPHLSPSQFCLQEHALQWEGGEGIGEELQHRRCFEITKSLPQRSGICPLPPLTLRSQVHPLQRGPPQVRGRPVCDAGSHLRPGGLREGV